mmetsp:Transcript_15012/g.30353  ORF Transcript_15012/g.30353 Transcript_15012/m.30353 type:complete len:407 (-) Transcript_15012:931-2151(-)
MRPRRRECPFASSKRGLFPRRRSTAKAAGNAKTANNTFPWRGRNDRGDRDGPGVDATEGGLGIGRRRVVRRGNRDNRSDECDGRDREPGARRSVSPETTGTTTTTTAFRSGGDRTGRVSSCRRLRRRHRRFPLLLVLLERWRRPFPPARSCRRDSPRSPLAAPPPTPSRPPSSLGSPTPSSTRRSRTPDPPRRRRRPSDGPSPPAGDTAARPAPGTAPPAPARRRARPSPTPGTPPGRSGRRGATPVGRRRGRPGGRRGRRRRGGRSRRGWRRRRWRGGRLGGGRGRTRSDRRGRWRKGGHCWRRRRRFGRGESSGCETERKAGRRTTDGSSRIRIPLPRRRDDDNRRPIRRKLLLLPLRRRHRRHRLCLLCRRRFRSFQTRFWIIFVATIRGNRTGLPDIPWRVR